MRMIISGGILAGDIFTNRVIFTDSSWPGRDWLWGSPQDVKKAAPERPQAAEPEQTPAGRPEMQD